MAASTEVSTRMRIGYVLVVVTGIAAAAWYMNRPVWELQNIVGVSGTVESNVLDVAVVSGRCNGGPKVRHRETSDEVTLRAEQDVRGDCDGVAVTQVLTVELAEALGDRRLRIEDSSDGVICRIEGSTTDPCV